MKTVHRHSASLRHAMRVWLPALLIGLAATLAVAAVPVREGVYSVPAGIVQFLPADTVGYLRVKSAHSFWQQLAQSPMRAKIENAPVREVADGFAQAQAKIAAFEAKTGIDVEQTVSAVFGNDFALALFADGTGVFVAQAADTAALQSAVSTVLTLEQNNVQDEHFELYQGTEICVRVVADAMKPGQPAKTRYHAIVGDKLIISRTDAPIKSVIDVIGRRAASIASSADYQKACEHLKPQAVGHVYVNTRRLGETNLLGILANGHLKNPLFRIWQLKANAMLKMTDHMVINFTPEKDAWVFDSVLGFDPDKAPASSLALMPPAGATLFDMERFTPANTTAAFHNRVNKSALWNQLMTGLRENRPMLAQQVNNWAQQIAAMFTTANFENEFLGKFGDQTSLFLTPGTGDGAPALNLVVELNNGQVIPQTLQTLAGTFATVNKMEKEQKGQQVDVSLRRTQYNNANLLTVDLHTGKAAGIVTPTLFTVDQFMVISTSEQAARAIVDAYRAPRTLDRPMPYPTMSRGFVSFRGLREILTTHQAFLISEAVKKGKPRETAETDFRNVDFLMSFIDRVDFRAGYIPGRLIRSCAIHLDTEPQ